MADAPSARARELVRGAFDLHVHLGQRGNPPVDDGLALVADRLLEAGFSETEVRTMAVDNTRRLAEVAVPA